MDEKKILGCGHYNSEFTFAEGYCSGMTGPELKDWLEGQEIHSPDYKDGLLRAYLDISVEQTLHSKNPFIKALAIINRRISKRTLEKINLEESEHTLVKRLYELRYGNPHV